MSTQPLDSPTFAVPASSLDDCRKADNCHQQHFIDDVFPLREVHLFAGPSGAGKTTMLMDMILAWQKGEPWFGHATHPLPAAYISLDRSLANLRRVFDRMHINFDVFPAKILTRRDYAEFAADVSKKIKEKTKDPNAAISPSGLPSLVSFLRHLTKLHPEVRVFIVEAVQSKVESARSSSPINDEAAVSKFLIDLGEFCERADVTVVGICHTPKLKEDDQYGNPRERIKGAGAWGAYSDTVVLVEPDDATDVHNVTRNVWLLPRNSAQDKFQTEYHDGHLVRVEKQQNPVGTTTAATAAGKPTNLARLIAWFRAQALGRIVTTPEMLAENDIPESSLRRERNKLVAEGLLSEVKHGTFRVELADEVKIAKLLGAPDTNWLAFQAWLKQQPIGRTVTIAEICAEAGIAVGDIHLELGKALHPGRGWLRSAGTGEYEITGKEGQADQPPVK